VLVIHENLCFKISRYTGINQNVSHIICMAPITTTKAMTMHEQHVSVHN